MNLNTIELSNGSSQNRESMTVVENMAIGLEAIYEDP